MRKKPTDTRARDYLKSEYKRFSYTNNYIIAYAYKKHIYCTVCTFDDIPADAFITDKKPNGETILRLYMNTGIKLDLMAQNFYYICPQDAFEDTVKHSQYNRGDTFERIIYSLCKQEWKKDVSLFTDKGDIVINGISYQIKFDRATFTSEEQIKRLQWLYDGEE